MSATFAGELNLGGAFAGELNLGGALAGELGTFAGEGTFASEWDVCREPKGMPQGPHGNPKGPKEHPRSDVRQQRKSDIAPTIIGQELRVPIVTTWQAIMHYLPLVRFPHGGDLAV